MRIFITGLLIIYSLLISAQTFFGKVVSNNNHLPVEYANIGVINKNIGTTSNAFGEFSINLPAELDNDTLRVSCIGFETTNIVIDKFKRLKIKEIQLAEKIYKLSEVIIIPKRFKEKLLGVTSKSKSIQAGFSEHILGKEMGIILPIKKSAKLKKINLNIATCNFDSIFYRINVYEVRNRARKDFENILQSPIYINIPKSKVGNTISIDVENKNIRVNGNCLVTIEFVRDLGKGQLYFCAGIGNNTYHRATSQGKWSSVPIGIGLNVLAEVEY
jgi:hypothetical protein